MSSPVLNLQERRAQVLGIKQPSATAAAAPKVSLMQRRQQMLQQINTNYQKNAQAKKIADKNIKSPNSIKNQQKPYKENPLQTIFRGAVNQMDEAHFADKMDFFTPLGFVANIAQSTLNTPKEAAKGVLSLMEHKQAGTSNPKQIAGDIAAAVQLPLLFFTGGESTVAKEGIKQTIKSTIAQSGKGIAKSIGKESGIGAAFGLLGGLQSGRDIKNNNEYLDNLIKNVGSGAAIGTGFAAAANLALPLAKGLPSKFGSVFLKQARKKDETPRVQHIQMAPKVAQSTVLGNEEIAASEFGKKVLSESLKAEKTGQHVAITPTRTGKYKTPTGERVSIYSIDEYNPTKKIESFEKNIDEYRRFGGRTEGGSTENAALRDVAAVMDNKDVIKHTREKVKQAMDTGEMIPDKDGMITLYRGGKPSDHNGLVSASYNKDVAELFNGENGGDLYEFKVKPEEIKAFIGRAEAEVLVGKESILSGSNEELFSNLNPDRLKTYGKDTAEAGTSMFGEPSKLGKELIVNAKKEYDQLGVLYVATKDIKVRRDVAKILRYLSGGFADDTKIERLTKLKENLESVGTPEGKIIINTIDKMLDGRNAGKDGTKAKIPETKTEELPGEVKIERVFDKKGNEITNKKIKVFNSKESRAVQEVVTNQMEEKASTAGSQEELIKEVTKVLDNAIEKANGERYALSGIRTAVNKEMFKAAGISQSSNFGANWAELNQIIKESPDIGKYVGMLLDKRYALDDALIKAEPKPAVKPETKISEQIQPPKPKPEVKVIKKTDLETYDNPVGTGKLKNSRFFERLKESFNEETPDEITKANPQYKVMNREESAFNAVHIATEDPQRAVRIANGLEKVPDGMTTTDMRKTLAAIAREKQDWESFNKWGIKASLGGTRYGQEIVSFRGRNKDSNPLAYVDQIVKQQKENILKRWEKQIHEEYGVAKDATTATKVKVLIEKQTEKLKTKLTEQQKRIQSAQSIIDALKC